MKDEKQFVKVWLRVPASLSVKEIVDRLVCGCSWEIVLIDVS